MAETPPWVLETKSALEGIIKKPKLTEKLLQKPPFKFLHDIVSNVTAATGFASDVITPEEQNVENIQGKEGKIAYLTKIIDHVAAVTGESIPAKPGKIIAGAEPENTNQFLQSLARAATRGSSSTSAKESIQEEANSEQISEDAEPTKKKKVKVSKKEGGKKTTKKKKTAENESSESSEGGTKKKAVKKKKEESNGEAPKKTKGTDGKKKVVKKKKAEAESLTLEQTKEEPKKEESKEEPKKQKPPKQEEAAPARPQTARPAPPRIQSNVRTVEKSQLESQAPVQLTYFFSAHFRREASGLIEEDEEETDEIQPTLMDDDEERVDLSANISQLEEEAHGGLVRDILQANKEMEKKNDLRNSSNSLELASKHNREVLEKEVGTIREAIQTLVKSVNPFAKAMEYAQEDFENMTKEYESWRSEGNAQLRILEDEKRETERQLQVLVKRFEEYDVKIKETLQKIGQTKSKIIQNDETIAKMMRGVLSSS